GPAQEAGDRSGVDTMCGFGCVDVVGLACDAARQLQPLNQRLRLAATVREQIRTQRREDRVIGIPARRMARECALTMPERVTTGAEQTHRIRPDGIIEIAELE